MAFSIKCPECGSSLTVVEALIGKTIKCKTCGTAVTVAPPRGARPAAPVAAKPLPAGVEAAELDVGDEPLDALPLDDEPTRPTAARPREEYEEDDDPAPAKRSLLPLLLGGLAALVAVGGIGAAAVYFLNRDDGNVAVGPALMNDDDIPISNPRLATPPTGPEPQRARIGTGGAPGAGGTPRTTTSPAPTKSDASSDDNPFNRGAKKTQPAPESPKSDKQPTTVTPAAVSPPAAKPDKLDPATLAKLKAGTVYLEVDDGRGGGGAGTGFFTGDPGLIVTNAHVLGMKLPGSKEPAKISAFVEAGQAKQRLFEGPKVKVLAVDREKDLAVLQIVNEKDLPPPLPVKASAGLNELDRLVVLGFPGGRRLSERNGSNQPPVVSLTEATVSAFRNDDFGNRNSIQVQGGINHGNSGGPVVDYAGNVVGVAVRVDLNHNGQLTTIAEAVPSEYVTGLLAGRTGRLDLGQAYIRGERVVVPVSVKVADPLGRLKAVGVGFWIGEKNGRPRPPGDTHQEQGGDVGYKEVTLDLTGVRGEAVGEIDFPLQADGRAYWAQPFHSNALVAKRYAAGNPVALASPPVAREPGDVRVKYPLGSRREFTLSQTVHSVETAEVDGKEERWPRTIAQQFTAEERVEKPPPKAAASYAHLDYAFSGLSAKLKVAGEEQALPRPIADAVAASRSTTVSVTVNKAGEPTAATDRTSPPAGADAGKKEALARYGRQIAGVIREGTLKLAGKSVNAGDTWAVSRPHWVNVDADDLLGERTGDARRTRQTQEELTVTYLGRRDRSGRAELVLKLDGTLRPVEGAPAGSVHGTVKGSLVIEDKTGAILEGEWTRTFDLDTSEGGVRKRATGTEETTISRGK